MPIVSSLVAHLYLCIVWVVLLRPVGKDCVYIMFAPTAHTLSWLAVRHTALEVCTVHAFRPLGPVLSVGTDVVRRLVGY